MNKKKGFLRIFTAVLAAVALLMPTAVLTGCSIFGSVWDEIYTVEFTRSSISLSVGDTYDLSTIIDGDTRSYSLSVEDSAIAKIKGRKLTAVGVGITYVTVQAGADSDRLTVRVSEAVPDTFSITAKGALVQTMGELSSVTFTPNATGSITNEEVVWYVNGVDVGYYGYGSSYEFTPTAAGEYVISAECGALSDSVTVLVYYAVTVSASHSGELEQQSAPYTPIVFDLDISRNEHNPDNLVECYEDNRLVYSGSSATVSYNPTPGRHNITVYVNGKREYSVTVFAKGSITPSAPTVEFDNLFPHVYLRFSAVGEACVEITSPGGDRAEFTQSGSYAELFDDNGMDVGGLISLCALGSTRLAYTFRVKSLGDGDALTESEYSEAYTFTQLPSAAREYIENTVLDIDHYVTSDGEYVELLEYYINFRNKTVSSPKVNFECYIAYSMSGDEQDLWNDAFPIAATSGSYGRISVTLARNVMTTSFTVNTVNNPSRQSKGTYAEQLHAVLPHINYDSQKYRPDDYVFPIDLRERTTTVTYSDELYIAAQYNSRPLPTHGSSAETIYNLARDVLRKICSDDMTDVQKAHAIYDWILWQVTYDTPATRISRNGEAYSAYYMEGVFGNGSTYIDGVAYNPYAVCDGMSKAYALMCNIEGIPCVRVAGEAGLSLRDAGGHAWNKVYVSGAWYTVDCTWGDSTSELSLNGGRYKEYELGLHDNLFITDEMTYGTHFEPYQSESCEIEYSPKTASVRYNVYSEMTYNGVAIDCKIARWQNQIERLREIASAFADAYTERSSIYIPGGPNNGMYTIDYQGVDIYVEGGIDASSSSLRTAVTETVRRKLPRADVHVYDFDEYILILIK